jgi:cytochrome P450
MCYHLAKYPEHAERAFQELNSTNVDIHNSAQLSSLPHFNGIIHETLRLVPPQLTGSGRLTPSTGLQVGDTWIPGGVKVSAPKYVVARSPEAFEYPDDFIPERWYSRPELIHAKQAYAPFSSGKLIPTETRRSVKSNAYHYS